MSEEKQETNGFLAGVIFGAIVGGAMAMFLSGEEGEELRKNLRQKGKLIFKNLGLLVEETASEGVEVIQEEKQAIGKTIETIKDEGKKTIRHFFLRAGRKLS